MISMKKLYHQNKLAFLSNLPDERPFNNRGKNSRLHSCLAEADLDQLRCDYESWEIEGSSAELNYLSHGFFRFFGKFPPPVAKRFILEFHDPEGGPVVDPMVGSGTTLVEAILLKRVAIGLDVNPLACLISKVKTTPIPRENVLKSLTAYNHFYKAELSEGLTPYIPNDRYLDHWFYPETQQGIARTRFFIDKYIKDENTKNFFNVALAAIIRRLSRASNGMGRMFLDPAIPPQDVSEHLTKKAMQMSKVCNELLHLKPRVQVLLHDAREPFLSPAMTNLVICHPPYFNLYRYSSIFKYEMLWLGYDYKDTRQNEVREGFKIGKKELVNLYVSDLEAILRNIARILVRGGWCVFMMGDTILRGERINTTAFTIRRITESNMGLRLCKIIVRHPKFTEASYAATQRRTKENVGVKLSDHLIVMQRVSS